MARNRNFVNNQRVLNYNIKGYYMSPKKSVDIIASIPNWADMDNEEMKEYVNNMKLFTDNEISTFQNDKKNRFWCKDGTTDVYTKRGLDYEIDEVLDRQLIVKQTWRLATRESSFEFKSGGMIFVGDKSFIIIKVINQLAADVAQQKLKAVRNMNLINRYGEKILVLL